AWQIDKRQAWRKTRNLATGLVALSVLGGLGLWGFIAYEDHVRTESERQVARDVRSGKVPTLSGVNLGDTRDQVLYAWGQPRSEEEDVLLWSEAGGEKAVMLSKEGRARVILCAEAASGYHYDCDGFAGLFIGDSEARV